MEFNMVSEQPRFNSQLSAHLKSGFRIKNTATVKKVQDSAHKKGARPVRAC